MEHAEARYTTTSGRLVEPGVTDADRHHALFTHLAGLLSLADFTVLGPIFVLILWRLRAKESIFIDDHGREALNYQLSLLLYTILGVIVIAILTGLTSGIAVILTPIGIAFIFALRIVGCIMAGVAANRREYFRYPMCIRFISVPAQ